MSMLANSDPEPVSEAVSSNAISLLSLMKLKGVGRAKALQIVGGPMIETGSESCREALLSGMVRANLAAVGSIELADAWRRSEDQLERSGTWGSGALISRRWLSGMSSKDARSTGRTVREGKHRRTPRVTGVGDRGNPRTSPAAFRSSSPPCCGSPHLDFSLSGTTPPDRQAIGPWPNAPLAVVDAPSRMNTAAVPDSP